MGHAVIERPQAEARPAGRLSPRTEAMAFRIWAECTANGWDRTLAEVAEALGVTAQRIRAVAALKGWQNRFRSASFNKFDLPYRTTHTDRDLESLSGRWAVLPGFDPE